MAIPLLIAGLVFFSGVALAGVSDLLRFRIPNGIVIGMLAACIVAASLSSLTWAALAFHTATGAMVLAGGFACFASGWCGAGDAKLAGVIALWLGFPAVLNFLLASAIVGGLLAFIIAVLCRMPSVKPTGPASALISQIRARRAVPFGVAMAIGAFVTVASASAL